MNCKVCGAFIGSNTAVCPECGYKNEVVFDGRVCLHCGYKGELKPAKMIKWYDWLIVFATFPLGLFYLLYIFVNRKDQAASGYICPACGKTSVYPTSSDKANKEQFKTVVKTVVTDENVRKSVKDMKKSVKDLHNTFYID